MCKCVHEERNKALHTKNTYTQKGVSDCLRISECESVRMKKRNKAGVMVRWNPWWKTVLTTDPLPLSLLLLKPFSSQFHQMNPGQTAPLFISLSEIALFTLPYRWTLVRPTLFSDHFVLNLFLHITMNPWQKSISFFRSLCLKPLSSHYHEPLTKDHLSFQIILSETFLFTLPWTPDKRLSLFSDHFVWNLPLYFTM